MFIDRVVVKAELRRGLNTFFFDDLGVRGNSAAGRCGGPGADRPGGRPAAGRPGGHDAFGPVVRRRPSVLSPDRSRSRRVARAALGGGIQHGMDSGRPGRVSQAGVQFRGIGADGDARTAAYRERGDTRSGAGHACAVFRRIGFDFLLVSRHARAVRFQRRTDRAAESGVVGRSPAGSADSGRRRRQRAGVFAATVDDGEQPAGDQHLVVVPRLLSLVGREAGDVPSRQLFLDVDRRRPGRAAEVAFVASRNAGRCDRAGTISPASLRRAVGRLPRSGVLVARVRWTKRRRDGRKRG